MEAQDYSMSRGREEPIILATSRGVLFSEIGAEVGVSWKDSCRTSLCLAIDQSRPIEALIDVSFQGL